jgi:hypothetical protein
VFASVLRLEKALKQTCSSSKLKWRTKICMSASGFWLSSSLKQSVKNGEQIYCASIQEIVEICSALKDRETRPDATSLQFCMALFLYI